MAAAIEDPAGDVTQTVGGEPVDAPFVDILEVTALVRDDQVEFRMRLAAPAGQAPPGAVLRFLIPFALAGDGDASLYGQADGTVGCEFTVDARTFTCADTSEKFAVMSATRSDRNVTVTLALAGREAPNLLVAGLAAMEQDGNITAQDFTDNALPYSTRPETPDTPPPTQRSWWRSWQLWAVLAVAAGLLVWMLRR